MEKVIKVGHPDNPANHWRINDKSVSRNHLEVRKIDDDTFHIKDLDSINGTYINEIPIVESTLKRDQNISLGYQKFTGDEFFDRVGRFFLDRRTLWVDEFHALEKEFKKYEKAKSKINQAFQTKMNLLRGAIVLVIVGLFLVYGGNLGIPPEFRILTSFGAGILAGLIVPKLISAENNNDKLMELRKVYSKVLVCPRCRRDLSSSSYKFWKDQRRCICDAIWDE